MSIIEDEESQEATAEDLDCPLLIEKSQLKRVVQDLNSKPILNKKFHLHEPKSSADEVSYDLRTIS